MGDDYDKLTTEQVADVIDDLLEYEKKDALARRLKDRYGIAAGKAGELAEVTLEPNHASLSREAMRKLLPRLEGGLASCHSDAGRTSPVVPRMRKPDICDLLPPVLEAVRSCAIPWFVAD